MKAISLWQPWASLIAVGVKPYETRSWAPPQKLIGQTIAIHAAKAKDKATSAFCEDIWYGQSEGGFDLADKLKEFDDATPLELKQAFGNAVMAAGCIVCTATLDAAFRLGERAAGTMKPAASTTRRLVSRPMPGCFTVAYDPWGDYAPGRWAWLLTNVKRLLPPAPAVGRQGFFELPQGWLCP